MATFQTCIVLLLFLVEATATVKNYYEILKVEKTATESQIKKAFRRLAVKFHPDKNRSADAEKVFREMAEAYSVLSDKEKRRQYDSMGHEAFLENADTDQEQDSTFHYNFQDIFHDPHGSPFMEDFHFHWSFPLEEEEEMEHFSFSETNFFFFPEDENEEDLY
ncbi:DnaJ-like protein subfamily B member 9 [Oryzias melastigma]|uniref:DnaJ homolog subfamily B member 9 n=1 Tax=Oryzias melastigma TaxID=30732 RepID=A0A834C4M8_ORYME|nr:DnaJ-like protein subfamily B member 9 [Oryzias melastigma]